LTLFISLLLQDLQGTLAVGFNDYFLNGTSLNLVHHTAEN